MRRRTPLPVVVLSALTREELEPVELAIGFGLPDPVLVRHELDLAAGAVLRVVSDATGVLEKEVVPLDHTCASCALRHEIVPTLTRLAETGRWSSLVLSLPPATQPQPLVRGIQQMIGTSAVVRRALRLGAQVAVASGATLLHDVFGDDLLRERDPERHPGDARAVGEVLVDALELADVVLLPEPPGGVEAAVLAELSPGRLAHEASALEPSVLLAAPAYDLPRPDTRSPLWVPDGLVPGEGDGVYDATSPAAAALGVWTVLVDTWRPFHPDRLLEGIESYGGHGYRGRGCFWLPTHPDSLAVWAGAGGQLSIGTAPGRPARGPRTRLVITGIDERRDEVMADLDAALTGEVELAAGLARWVGRDDGFDPWLGDRAENA